MNSNHSVKQVNRRRGRSEYKRRWYQRNKEARESGPRDLPTTPDATVLMNEKRKKAAARMRELRKRRKAESCRPERSLDPLKCVANRKTYDAARKRELCNGEVVESTDPHKRRSLTECLD